MSDRPENEPARGDPRRPLRIVTVNSHQPYLHLLAGLGHPVTVVDRGLRGFGCRWRNHVRPLPDHFATVGQAEAAVQARALPFDVGLAHNVTDLLALKELSPRLVLLIHGSLEGRVANEASRTSPEAFLQATRRYLELVPAHVVTISPLKARSWRGLPQEVIRHGIPADVYRGWTGEIPAVLRVANLQRRRDPLLDHTLQQEAMRGVPNRLLGWNPDVPGAGPARDWEDLKDAYRRHRCILVTNRHPLEDGFNLSLLEAMATGMPVLTTPHPTSPVVHGENGLVGESAAELRHHAGRLLQDRKLAAALGRAARRTVLESFPYAGFLAAWDRLLRGVAAGSRPGRPAPAATGRPRLTLLPGGAAAGGSTGSRPRPLLHPI